MAWMGHTLSQVDGHLGGFHLSAIVNKDAVNMAILLT